MRLPQTIKDPYVVTGALGALLTLSVVLVHLPATIYGGNAGEFGFSLLSLLPFGLVVGIPAFLALVLLLLVLPRRARMLLAGVLCGLGFCLWVYGNFLFVDTLIIDGRQSGHRFDTWLGNWELPAILAAVAAVAALTIRLTKPVATFLVLLNIGLVVGTAWQIVRDTRLSSPSPIEASEAEVHRFSTRGNVLLVLMDSLQADVLDRIVASDPDLRRSLDGFTLFRDTLGVAPTTVISMPAIHSGVQYAAGQTLHDYYDRGVAKGSFLARLASEGYASTLVNPINGVCPAGVSCTLAELAIGERLKQTRKSALRLLDFSLLRVAPFVLKDRVYRENEWLLSNVGFDIYADNILNSNRLLDVIASNLHVDSGPPAAKFLHLFSTHHPFLLRDDCRTLVRQHADELLDGQVRCALRGFAGLLDAMKRKGVYDNTAIALIADHGYGIGTGFVEGNAPVPAAWRSRAGSANPVFMLKPPGSHGELAHSDNPVSITDVAFTLCRVQSAECAGISGRDARRATERAPRSFAHYVWNHAWWRLPTLPEESVVRYRVDGPLWEPRSWRASKVAGHSYRLGEMIDFRDPDARPALPGDEWSVAEPTGTWTNGPVATLALDLDALPDADLQIEVFGQAFVHAKLPVQRVEVQANDVEIARWSFEVAEPIGTRTARIPRALVASRRLQLSFLLPDAAAPASLGLSSDHRSLALAFRTLRVSAADAPAEARAGAPR